jgi:hypothetical protein
MTRKLVVLLIAGLVVAPAASAKGPHAVLTPGPEAVEAGRPWRATLELNEFPRSPHPLVVASRGDRSVKGRLRPTAPRMPGAAGFGLRMVFPAEGRWPLVVVAGKRRFAFPAVVVGGADAPQNWVAFPKGSRAERDGAGGVWTEGPEVQAGSGGAQLPPETVSLAEPPDDDGGGLALWIPALGLALAGAGIWSFRSGVGRRD